MTNAPVSEAWANGGEPPPRSQRRHPLFATVWLMALAAIAVVRMARRMDHTAIPDAVHRYFPYATRLMNEGLGFLLSPESAHVAPLGYLWPALFGNDVLTIRWVNACLFLVCLVLLWHICQRLCDTRAAVIATLLMVAHPPLYTLFPVELTEPLFMTGIFVWVFGLVGIAQQPDRRWRYIAVAAVGLAITLLSRPVLQFTALILMLLALMFGNWPGRLGSVKTITSVRRISHAIALSIAMAFVPAAAIAFKNGYLFGVWGIATGSGAALVLGLHPLSLGAEPSYLGLDYDVTALALMVPGTQGDHLDPAADRMLKLVAMDFLRSMSPGEAVAFFSRKLWWWMFHHPAHGSALRSWRVFQWGVLALFAVASLSKKLQRDHVVRALDSRPAESIIALLCIVVASLLAQFQIVLYNSRYSTGLLEPWLLILTGVGLSMLTRPWRLCARNTDQVLAFGTQLQLPRGASRVAFMMGALILISGPFLAARWMKKSEFVTLDVRHHGPTELVFASTDQTGVTANGLTQVGPDQWRMNTSPAALIVPSHGPYTAPTYVNGIWLLRFAIQAKHPERCSRAEVAYTNPVTDVALITPTLALDAHGGMQTYAVHANGNMRPAGAGALRIAFHCPTGTLVNWHGMELHRSNTYSIMARHLALQSSTLPRQPTP